MDRGSGEFSFINSENSKVGSHIKLLEAPTRENGALGGAVF